MTINKYLDIYNNIFTLDKFEIKNSFNCFNLFNDIEITKHNIIKLLGSQYVIFSTNYFYHIQSKLLKYFLNNKIIYLNYYLKDIILYKINKINNIINSKKSKYNKIKKKIKLILNLKKLKSIYFLDNKIEPNTIYRKVKFSNEEIFLSFNS